MNLVRTHGEFRSLGRMSIGAVSPEIMDLRANRIRALDRRWGEIEVLSQTVPSEIRNLLDAWESEVLRVRVVFAKATTEEEFAAGSRIFSKMEAWEQHLLSLGATPVEEVPFRPSSRPREEDPVVNAPGISGWVWAGLALGAGGLYLLWKGMR